jgi:DNA-binding LytR/AlgR family response regulator
VQEIKTLKAFEEELGQLGFIRICRNTIINSKYLTKITSNQNKRMVYLGDIALHISKKE